MKFVLRVESPVHVGTGDVVPWLDYHLEGKLVHVLDVARILETAGAKHENVVERFAEWSDRAARVLEDNAEIAQKAASRERAEILRRSRDETSLARFARDELKDDELARGIREGAFDRYRGEFSGGRLDRRLEIKECAKDASGAPTIPGSTLRGQIRSALIHAALSGGSAEIASRVMGGSPEAEGWKKSLADATPGRARFLFGDALERAVLRPPQRMDDPRFDLMRFVRVSEPLRARTKVAFERATAYFIRGDKLNPLAPAVCEVIAEGSEFEFEIRADAALASGLARADGGTHAMVSPEFWAGFARVFGVTREEAKELDPEALEARMLSAIEVALAARYAAITRRENAWFTWAGAPADAPLRQFHDGFSALEGRVSMRLGMGAGLHGVTALLAIETDPQLREPLSRALARTGLGLDPKKRRERAEREKVWIERARKDASQKHERSPGLRPELVDEKRDPSQLPVTRAFTMDGPLPDLFVGCVTLARGELSAESVADGASLAAKTRALRAPRVERDDSRRLERAASRPPRDDRRDRRGRDEDRRDDRRGPPGRDDRGPRRPDRPKGPPPKPLPDRPATEDEIAKLLERFGKR